MTTPQISPIDYWWPFAALQLGRTDWDRYAKGYRRAATLLLSHLAGNPAELEVLLFPLVQSYRHYLELRLKELLLSISRLHGRTVQVPITHRLCQLWDQVRPALAAKPLEVGAFDLEQADYLIDKVMALDPFATDWRYPHDSQGRASARGLEAVNPAWLSQLLGGFGDILDGFSMLVDHELTAKARQQP